MSNLSKVLPVEERTFSKVYQMMRAKRAAMPQDPLAGFRPRRMSDGPIRGLNLPPVTPEPIVKPLSVVSIDSEELDLEDTEPTPLEGEVMAPVIVEAGDEESDPPETDESESGDESLDIGQDAYQAEE